MGTVAAVISTATVPAQATSVLFPEVVGALSGLDRPGIWSGSRPGLTASGSGQHFDVICVRTMARRPPRQMTFEVPWPTSTR